MSSFGTAPVRSSRTSPSMAAPGASAIRTSSPATTPVRFAGGCSSCTTRSDSSRSGVRRRRIRRAHQSPRRLGSQGPRPPRARRRSGSPAHRPPLRAHSRLRVRVRARPPARQPDRSSDARRRARARALRARNVPARRRSSKRPEPSLIARSSLHATARQPSIGPRSSTNAAAQGQTGAQGDLHPHLRAGRKHDLVRSSVGKARVGRDHHQPTGRQVGDAKAAATVAAHGGCRRGVHRHRRRKGIHPSQHAEARQLPPRRATKPTCDGSAVSGSPSMSSPTHRSSTSAIGQPRASKQSPTSHRVSRRESDHRAIETRGVYPQRSTVCFHRRIGDDDSADRSRGETPARRPPPRASAPAAIPAATVMRRLGTAISRGAPERISCARTPS